MRRKIALYVHPAHRFGPTYLLYFIVETWRRRGIELEVVDDPARHVDADLAFLHVDLTEVPAAYRGLLDRYPVVVNGRRTSIAKRAVSGNLLTRDSDYDGPVIVKTNENTAGIPDDRARGWGPVWHPAGRRMLDAVLPRRLTGGMFALRYHVYETLADVPPIVWSLDRMVVEKFLPERAGDLYAIRYWEFLGGCHITDVLYSETPYVKASGHIRRALPKPDPAAPSQLLDWRRRFGLDYGKFDYAMGAGQLILFDVNPTVGAYRNLDAQRQTVATLADGIDPFFEHARRIATGSAS
jgi:hypothetical protein